MNSLITQVHPSSWNFLWDALSAFALSLAAALAILWIGWWIARRVGRWFAGQTGIDATLRPIARDTAAWAVRIVALIGALSQIGIQTASIVAVLGAAGLAIGLALQGTLQNIAAGIMLLLLRPFKVGDYIDGGGGNVAGTVEEINLFTTRLTKPDGICEFVPNSALWSNSIRNYSRNRTRRRATGRAAKIASARRASAPPHCASMRLDVFAPNRYTRSHSHMMPTPLPRQPDAAPPAAHAARAR